MCGKDKKDLLPKTQCIGSPPHVRERHDFGSDTVIKARITPACAGKTHLDDFALHINEDHPRMCGKDFSYCYSLYLLLGSPPHVRERPILDD